MLDQMRKHSRSFIIYILFGIIIAVFVVNFGPQSAGCTAGTSYAGKVEGRAISGKLFAYALSVAGIRSQQVPEPQMIRLRSMVMDQLLMRELFADDALKLGVRVPEKDIDDMLLKGRFLALGQPRPLIRNDDGEFDYDLFSRYVRFSWQLTVKKFKADQRRELLAEKFRQFLKSSVKVSEDEVRKDFAQKNTQVQLSYVRFTPGEFSSMVKTDPAKVSAYLASNKKKVKDYYEENKNAYQKLPKQVHLQVIRIDAKDAAKKGAAKQRAVAAFKRLKAGEDFAKVAEEVSDDKASRNSGGMLTWRNEDSPGVGDAADKAVAKLKDGELSDLLENEDSFSIVKLLGRRQGDLSLAQAQAEIAEDLFRSKEALALAKETAAGFLKRIKGGEKLTDLFKAKDADSDTDTDADKDKEEEEATAEKDEKEKTFELAETSFFPRSGRFLVPGIGISKELMNAVFKLKSNEVAEKPHIVDQIVYLVAVKEKKDPDWKEWDKNKDDLTEAYLTQKWATVIREYAAQRCEEALKEKRLVINRGAMVTPGYQHPKGDPPLPSFAPCSSLRPEPTAPM